MRTDNSSLPPVAEAAVHTQSKGGRLGALSLHSMASLVLLIALTIHTCSLRVVYATRMCQVEARRICFKLELFWDGWRALQPQEGRWERVVEMLAISVSLLLFWLWFGCLATIFFAVVEKSLLATSLLVRTCACSG